MFSPEIIDLAERVLARARDKRIRIATAESCTGGLIAGALTEISGSSDVVECGFVVYSNEAKTRLLGVSKDLIDRVGAVSEEVARAMANGALENSDAKLAIAVTGIAGPSGGSALKRVGLVYIAAACDGRETETRKCEFGEIARGEVRMRTVESALRLLLRMM